jgi:hypothetical protein
MHAILSHIQELHQVLKGANMEQRTRAHIIKQVVQQPLDTWMDTIVDIARDTQ